MVERAGARAIAQQMKLWSWTLRAGLWCSIQRTGASANGTE
jgi:hypothetical protein